MHCTTGDVGLAGATKLRMSNVLFLLASWVLAVVWWLKRRCVPGGDGKSDLPPGPPDWPIVGNLFQVDLRPQSIIHTIDGLRERYGPIFKLRMGRRTTVIVSSAELIHEALVKRGALFATRPPDGPVRRIFTAGKRNVNSATYGPLWRALRRNLTAGIVSAPRIKQCAAVRDWAVEAHLARARDEFRAIGSVHVIDNCRITVASILVCMCFGARLPEGRVQAIFDVLIEVAKMMLPSLPDFFPLLAPLFRKQIVAARRLHARQLDLLMPLVAARREFIENGTLGPTAAAQIEMVIPAGGAYVDSLFKLETPPEKEEEEEDESKSKLSDENIVALCTEVISAGTDTTATALEWAMMHLVLDLEAQDRLYDEVVEAAGETGRIEEARLDAMPFLQAVVKETLRLHPPIILLLSHAVTEKTELGGYCVPADAVVDFYTMWAPRDPSVWADPKAWRPERFLVDSGEGVADDGGLFRMLPFGAGRRVCPGAALGTLHMQLMIAAMVREFKWVTVPGDAPPDTSEAFAFTIVMKNSLEAAIIERKPREH